MNILLGFFLIALGIVILKWGDKNVGETLLDKLKNRFTVRKVVVQQRLWLQWTLGLFLIASGLQIIFLA